MILALGEKLPAATLLEKVGDDIVSLSTGSILDGRRVVLFGLPGAFTGMCSTQHLPGFIAVAEALRAEGVDEIVCVSVNDPFVMAAWGETSGALAAGIRMLADVTGEFTGQFDDMTFDNPPRGLYGRSKRYALFAEDWIVRVLNLETSRDNCDVSGGPAMVEAVMSLNSARS